MIPDPTEEMREIKRRLSAQFDNDVHRIAEETRRRQLLSGRKAVTLPKLCPTSIQHAEQGGQSDREQAGELSHS